MSNNFPAMGQFSTPMMGLDAQQSLPKGHGRRHSVNVLNKTNGVGASISYSNPYGQDGFEDGFNPPSNIMPAHSRQASRADSSWRMSKFQYDMYTFILSYGLPHRWRCRPY